MSLNLEKLTNIQKTADGKTTARCPACARKKADTKGEHLVIYPDGRYGCVACPNDEEHRKEIWALAGADKAKGKREVAIARIPVRPFVIPPTGVILWTGRFGRSCGTPSGKSEEPENVQSPKP